MTQASVTVRPSIPRPAALARWLWAVALLVIMVVAVGGITRLTESGLSITEWKPVSGVLPPLTEAGWQAEFEKYKQIPEYREINAGMSLAAFKGIFFWEWLHRLWGRVIGLAFVLPLVFFWATGRIAEGSRKIGHPDLALGRCLPHRHVRSEARRGL